MMLNSRFELSKIEKNTRVEREICLATLENREWKENLFLPLSKIESRKRIVSCHSRKSRVEREMGTIKFSRSREKFLFLLSIFLSRARLSSMPDSAPQSQGRRHYHRQYCASWSLPLPCCSTGRDIASAEIFLSQSTRLSRVPFPMPCD